MVYKKLVTAEVVRVRPSRPAPVQLGRPPRDAGDSVDADATAETAGSGAGAGAGAGGEAPVGVDSDEEHGADHSDELAFMVDELCDLCRGGDWEAVSSFLDALADAGGSPSGGDGPSDDGAGSTASPAPKGAALVASVPGSRGRTALHVAARRGKIAIVADLLRRGADPTVQYVQPRAHDCGVGVGAP